MHSRRAILDSILDALVDAYSPPVPVYEQEQTAQGAPCFQVAAIAEVRGDQSSRAQLERELTLRVTARGGTPSERDALSEALENVLLDAALGGAFAIELGDVALEVPEDGGARTYPATYDLTVRYFTTR